MEGATVERTDELLWWAARSMTGRTRREFQGRVCAALCEGSPRKAEERFGWGRQNVALGMREIAGLDDKAAAAADPGAEDAEGVVASRRGRRRSEEKNPRLAADIRLIVEPHTQTDPELKTARQYTNLSAAEVLTELREKGYSAAELPSERTIRDILNRMNYRLKRIQKGKPLKKTKDTDAIFANVKAARETYASDAQTLEISVDTKAKVGLGEYARGGKNTDHQRRQSGERLGS
jgi:hypothetical protein